MLNRKLIATLTVGLILAGCGGGETDPTPAPEADVTTTAAAEPSDDGVQATETTQSDSDGETSASGQSRGTVTFDGETSEYEDFDGAICNTDYLGTGVFNTRLTNTDGSRETMTLTLYPDGDPAQQSTLALLSVEVTWLAIPTQFEGSGIDTFDIDGNHAEGTATLIASTGEGPVSATFDVTCG